MATCGLSSHDVVAAGSGDDAGRRQDTFSSCVYCGVEHKRYIRLIMSMAVGIYINLYLWLTVGALRLLDVLVTLWWLAPRS